MKKILSSIGLLVVVSLCYSASPANPNLWQCLSLDNLNRSYAGSGNSIRASMAAARKACINVSTSPNQCRVSRHWCEKGGTPTVGFSCESEDTSGKRFASNGADACQQALNQCETWQRKLPASQRHHCSILHA